MDEPADGVDVTTANPARIYDCGLGGYNNFQVDREQFDKLLEIDPDARLVVQSNRGFLRRAVRFCVEQGVRQFLDLGSGIPTVGNVHQAAHEMDPGAHVVYVDNEPIAAAQTRRLLADQPNAEIVQRDMRDVEGILQAEETRRLLDFSRPVGLIMASVLHWVHDDVTELLRAYSGALAPGSYLAISHLTDEACPEQMQQVGGVFDETTEPVTYRRTAVADELFAGFDIVEPGVVWTPEWRVDERERVANPERAKIWAAVGRKR